MIGEPLFEVEGLTHRYGPRVGCRDVSFTLRAGEVLAVVGESGSGKSTLLACASGRMTPSEGGVRYKHRHPTTGVEAWRDVHADLSEPERRLLLRTDFAFVHQDAREGLRMTVSAGGNIGESMMAVGAQPLRIDP